MEKLWYSGKKLWYFGKKLWYYTENYWISIYEEKKHGILPKTKRLWFIMEKNYSNILKKGSNKFIALQFWFTMKNYYGTMEKVNYS